MTQMETRMIGNKIAAARKNLNISQAQLAESLFISAQAVGKWERGESMPDIVTFNRLAEILGVDLNYFSENFQSAAAESLDKPSAELLLGKQQKKLRWDMSLGNWVNADFSGLKNLQGKFSSSNMKGCKFIGSNMSGLLLKVNHVESCDFSHSDLSNSHLQNSYLINNLFRDCSLVNAEFSVSAIKGCNFSGADLTGATVRSCDFNKNTMANAVLKRTTFSGAQINDIVFEGTLEDCYFENCHFKKVTFRNATLTDTFFKCKSLKRIQFIDCRADKMTRAFLKNGKADLTGISLFTP